MRYSAVYRIAPRYSTGRDKRDGTVRSLVKVVFAGRLRTHIFRPVSLSSVETLADSISDNGS